MRFGLKLLFDRRIRFTQQILLQGAGVADSGRSSVNNILFGPLLTLCSLRLLLVARMDSNHLVEGLVDLVGAHILLWGLETDLLLPLTAV